MKKLFLIFWLGLVALGCQKTTIYILEGPNYSCDHRDHDFRWKDRMRKKYRQDDGKPTDWKAFWNRVHRLEEGESKKKR